MSIESVLLVIIIILLVMVTDYLKNIAYSLERPLTDDGLLKVSRRKWAEETNNEN